MTENRIATTTTSELAARVERETGIRLKQIQTLLGSEAAAKRFARTLVMACESDSLQRCTPASVVNAAMDAARVGLEVGGPRAHAALVPFKDQAKLMVMVSGWLHVAKRDGAIVDAQTILVRAGEKFRWDPVADPPVKHAPSFGLDTPGEVIAAYVILRLPGGERIIEVVPGYYLARVEKFALSKAGDRQSPWKGEWREEMLKKTALRKALSRHLDPVRVGDLDALDSSPASEPRAEIAIDEPAPKARQAQVVDAEVVEPKPRSRREKPEPRPLDLREKPESKPEASKTESAPQSAKSSVMARVLAALALEGLSAEEAEKEVRENLGENVTDAQLEAFLANGCRV